ncbi:MAG: SRPBCC family protein [Actinomycetota bacterium]|nr:SRPBCC family protein [Actinomycetota bacterium]
MTMEALEKSVRTSIVVEAPIDRAFHVFTEEMASWWNPEHHILRAELAGMVFEPHVGGHIYDRGVDGSECRWARVLAYDPPRRLVFSWDISLRWELETDPDRTSEVEVRFEAEGAKRTRVDFEHRNLDRHGGGWEAMRDAVGSSDGWTSGLLRFAEQFAG